MTSKNPKNCQKNICETCEYICSYQSDYNRQLSTRKHKWKQMETNGNKFNEKNEKNRQMILTVSVVRVINTIVIIIDKKNVHIY